MRRGKTISNFGQTRCLSQTSRENVESPFLSFCLACIFCTLSRWYQLHIYTIGIKLISLLVLIPYNTASDASHYTPGSDPFFYTIKNSTIQYFRITIFSRGKVAEALCVCLCVCHAKELHYILHTCSIICLAPCNIHGPISHHQERSGLPKKSCCLQGNLSKRAAKSSECFSTTM